MEALRGVKASRVYVTRRLSRANTLGLAGGTRLYECVFESSRGRSYVSNVLSSLHAFVCKVLPPTYHLHSPPDSRLLHPQRAVFPSCLHSGRFPRTIPIGIKDGRDNDRLWTKINLGTDGCSNPTAAAAPTRLTLLGSHKHLPLTRWAVSPMLAASLTDYRSLTLVSLPSPGPSLLFSPVMTSLSLSLENK